MNIKELKNNLIVFHVIDSLGLGGAESLLVGSMEGLSTFCDNIIITLNDVNAFDEKLKGYTVINLGWKSNYSVLKAVTHLKRLIKTYNPKVIHAHLYWSTIIARIATPKSTKLIVTYHSLIYHPENMAQYSRKMLILDKILYKPYHNTVFISAMVDEVISSAINIKYRKQIIPNYVEDRYFQSPKKDYLELPSSKPLQIVSVGNLRQEKNYHFLIEVLGQFEATQVQLDIYGKGIQEEVLRRVITQRDIRNVTLKGISYDLDHILSKYDLFVMASQFEGFGIALAEAMAIGLPCLVSNIDSLVEITKGEAIYFDPNNPRQLKEILKSILAGNYNLGVVGKSLNTIANSYSRKAYVENLKKLYA